MKRRFPLPNQDELRALLDYDPSTGLFYWKVSRTGRGGGIGSVAGALDRKGHRDITIKGQRYKAHRLAWFWVHGEWPSDQIDHKDNCPDHNWIDNLRVATDSQNRMNARRPRHNTSGFKGVSWQKGRQKWQAKLQKDGRTIFIGRFGTAEEAQTAYQQAAALHFGAFARTG